MVFDEDTIADFWSKVDKSGPDQCWEWRSWNKGPQDYGKYLFSDGSTLTAHRMALIICTGKTGRCALHACDNRRCVNPRHLRWGTHRENMLDQMERGCQRENLACMAKGNETLTDADAFNIHLWRQMGFGNRKLAAAYGTARSNIAKYFGPRCPRAVALGIPAE